MSATLIWHGLTGIIRITKLQIWTDFWSDILHGFSDGFLDGHCGEEPCPQHPMAFPTMIMARNFCELYFSRFSALSTT